ncbi:hypothetical protein J15TS10_47690 [Paenibacillus woosongensis]|uniref:Resolvase/invertase-type recombinase catalytic domain-containing protein n=1 Tax=Paenibacillus woosongensis TaxID=307580 RepID=A0ABQ4MYE3_9BACL|nr:hypothetical protein J15TS10_47690 [Paenibacillus woosongensis]
MINCDKKFAEMSKMVQNDLAEGKMGKRLSQSSGKKRGAGGNRRVETLANLVMAGFFRHLNNL